MADGSEQLISPLVAPRNVFTPAGLGRDWLGTIAIDTQRNKGNPACAITLPLAGGSDASAAGEALSGPTRKRVPVRLSQWESE